MFGLFSAVFSFPKEFLSFDSLMDREIFSLIMVDNLRQNPRRSWNNLNATGVRRQRLEDLIWYLVDAKTDEESTVKQDFKGLCFLIREPLFSHLEQLRGNVDFERPEHLSLGI